MLLAAARRSLPGWASGPDAPDGAEGSPERAAYVAGFRDDLGTRRALDVLVVSAVLGIEPPLGEGTNAGRAAERAWRAAGGPAHLAGDAMREALPSLAASGPLAPEHREEGIEAWTEQELACLHALERVAIASKDAGLLARSLDAVRWHLEYLQPDNGTNRTWGIGAFVREGSPEALLHAETMLHACQMERGRADVVSAWLLLDAARGLRALGA
jgi:hypothetical protein